MATIVNKLGYFLLDCIMDKKDPIPNEAIEYAKAKVSIVFELSIKCIDQEYITVSMSVIEFLNHYLSIKKHTQLQAIDIESIKNLLNIIVKRIQYPIWDNMIINNNIEEMFNCYRGELTSIFGNMLLIPSIQEEIINYIGILILNLKNSYINLTPQQKEAPLVLFYKLAESFKGI